VADARGGVVVALGEGERLAADGEVRPVGDDDAALGTGGSAPG
jgi:hypothetical protein